jgi:hypothetical protein
MLKQVSLNSAIRIVLTEENLDLAVLAFAIYVSGNAKFGIPRFTGLLTAVVKSCRVIQNFHK